jgi:hypothetical protein
MGTPFSSTEQFTSGESPKAEQVPSPSAPSDVHVPPDPAVTEQNCPDPVPKAEHCAAVDDVHTAVPVAEQVPRPVPFDVAEHEPEPPPVEHDSEEPPPPSGLAEQRPPLLEPVTFELQKFPPWVLHELPPVPPFPVLHVPGEFVEQF